ncbi:bromodomain adjacent to zinc finger domain protein 1A-like [Anopheles funestus]|uniref:bromodomain adjacent to zinc finger domain protein 1A-like n=1 Tax=Anopheles funestus TaxID=62324 RepID=UPI0020C61577|nr:bromodomain adjacent to zinc finger domain protein 1A-like [Anopheles funestus]XP_049298593.1 bromodomain adjacent to zinc finger domain protein 1A-like [Anopheles funestus]XP_049298601.1 bromodomain adjacent to zinc finger domain protein 1A-like [Anopheles funestus]
MPLLRRQVLQKTSTAERLRDSEEVLFCQPTGEIFSNYEDYFHRIMLISSMVWSCAMTGRPNLTYSEALESEKAARKLLKTFPDAVKGPFLLVASHTQRTSINEMHEDVYGFVKDHLFKGEIVDAMDLTRKAFRRAVISDVLVDNTQGAGPVMYQVTADDNMTPRVWNVTPGNVKRDRSTLTRDKCKLFLKQHVEAGPGGQLRIKADSLVKFVTEQGWTDEQVFLGQAPNFEQSKRLKQNAERSEVSGASKPTKKKAPVEKTTKITTADGDKQQQQEEKPKKAKKQATKNVEKKGPAKVKQKSSTGKQQSIAKYIEKTIEPEILDAKAKKMAEEIALQKLKLEQEALAKKRLEEEKALLLQQAALALKRYNAVLEDQELTDQRPMPPVRSVRPLITSKHFGNFVFILEFLNSFSDLLAIRSKFSGGLTMHLLERALILREVNGPLSDIFQVLLGAIFTQQLEEENEVEVGYERVENLALKRQTVPEQARARDTVLWCEKHYCTKLSEMPIDSTTVSELLRLHFLSSGALVEEKATKHRYYNRGGYSNADDPGLRLVRDYPHILRALSSHSVYQLSIGDIIQILCCLIHQLLTYSGVRELVEERVDRARSARYNYQNNRYAQRRLTVKTGSQKNQARDDMKRELTAFEGDTEAREEHRKKLLERLEEQCNRIDAEAQRQMKILQTESGRLKEDFFDYQIYLGSDRCFRNYWLFESLPGLFVEHDRTYAGRCLDQPTPNIPGLAWCAQEQRKKYITKAIMRCAGTDGVAGLLDAKAIAVADPNQPDNGGRDPEVYEQLLTQGSAELERIEQQTAQTKALNSRANSEEPRTEGALNGDATAVPAANTIPLPPPSNRELLMCTAQPADCPVHTEKHAQTVSWGYYATADELDALIRSLNVRGAREKQLRETLECERDLILTHIEKCPIDKLSVNESDRAAVLCEIVSRNQKRYDAPNFSSDPGTDPNEILEAAFLENLLELEAKITVGYLGVMRVRDRDKWRTALEACTYDPQTDKPLQWGPKRLAKQEETNGKEKQEQDTEQQQPQDVDEDHDEHPTDNDSGRDSLERLLSDASNPGHNLPDTTVSLLDDTLDSDEIAFPLHESETLRQRVHALARALLQVAQCIDQKFLRHPFGPKKEHKDRTVMLQKQYQGLKNLVQWEVSLMRSTCFSQLFLHYNVLYDAIQWSRSAERICCMICRRKGDPGLTLLCDECNRACHTYCLKPKLKEVPAGDWYCMRCRPENFKEKRAPAKKKKIFKWVEDMEEEEEDESDEASKQEENEAEEEDEEEEEGEEEEEMDQDEGGEEAEEEQAEMEDMVQRKNVDGEDSPSEDSDSEDDKEDDGSDEEYRMRKSKQPVTKAKSRAKTKPAIVVTSSGRSSRSAAATNGAAYRDEEVEEDDDSYDEREERRKRRNLTLPNGAVALRADSKRSGAALRTRRATSVSSTKRKRTQNEESDVSPSGNTSKRPRRSGLTNGGRKMSVSPAAAAGSDEDAAGKKPRTSARSTKGQRRSSVYVGEEEEETVARLKMGSAARRSRRTGEDLPLNSVALYTLIDDILKHPSSWPFNRPVSAKEVPDYYAVIKNPMDFARIKSKLNMGDYKINEQMLSDVQLVFRNCDLYNTDETDVYRIGRELEQYVVKRCKELTLPFQPSDMQKSGLHPKVPTSKPINGVAGPHGK